MNAQSEPVANIRVIAIVIPYGNFVRTVIFLDDKFQFSKCSIHPMCNAHDTQKDSMESIDLMKSPCL